MRITHLPTGVVVTMQDERSQLQNKARAMQVLRARLLRAGPGRAATRELSVERASQVGGGGRGEKIRTYNFKENRLTDHRIGFTIYRLADVLAGDLDDVVDALHRRRAGAPARRRRLKCRESAAAPSRGGELWARDQRRRRSADRRRAGCARQPAAPRATSSLPSLDEPATERMVAHLDAMVARLRGRRAAAVRARAVGFRHLDLMVDRRVLIPRPETEQFVEVGARAAHARARRSCRVDLGTGSAARSACRWPPSCRSTARRCG